MTESSYQFSLMCLFGIVLLPYIAATISKIGAFSLKKDNADPRGFAAGLDGHRQRANYAQMNSFEAMAVILAGLFVAIQHQADPGRVNMLMMVILGARMAYVAAYTGNIPMLRSALFNIGFLSSIALFFL